jgi:hypothetical protein
MGTRSRLQWKALADVAQLVEHFTRNEGVPGSSPGVGLTQRVPSRSRDQLLEGRLVPDGIEVRVAGRQGAESLA